MKRILAAIAAVLIVGAIAAVAGGATAGASSSSQERSSQGIVIGHYEGRDSHGNHIRFKVEHTDAFYVTTFRVNHYEFGRIKLKDASFSHDCNVQNYCAHGHWTNIDKVSGGWRHRHGHTVSYTAHYVDHWSGN